VVLVFDAIGSGSGTVIRTTAKGAIDVVYVGDADADTFIMLEVDAWNVIPSLPLYVLTALWHDSTVDIYGAVKTILVTDSGDSTKGAGHASGAGRNVRR
jgi:hypothetical protein